MSLISQALPALDGGCAHGAFGRAGFPLSFTGLLTCAQLPPLRLVARWSRPTNKGRKNVQDLSLIHI